MKYSGMGWHRQSIRHSNARKYGEAGGIYASDRIRKILKKHPEYKNLSYKKLRGKGIFLKYQLDSDKDGAVNIKDCKPLNPNKQDLKETAKKVGSWIGKEAGIIKEKVKKEYKEYKRKRREAIGKAIAQATKQKIIDEKTEEEKEEITEQVIQEAPEKETNYKDLDMSNVFGQLKPEEAQKIAHQTTKALTKVEHKKIEDLADVDVKELSDEELKTIAIRLGTGFFGLGNKFENEIKRRIREREKLRTDLQIELEKEQAKSKKRLTELKKQI